MFRLPALRPARRNAHHTTMFKGPPRKTLPGDGVGLLSTPDGYVIH